uniref:Carrier domain-containing protein n=2 Tax=Pseudictyota dubia TaxID=2749911 RepID=A0A7R9W3C5_9STRA
MGQDLMQKSPVFRRTIERLQIETGMPLVELYNDGSSWMMKKNSVIGIVSYQLGLLAVLQDSGIRPDFFLGHSLGETVCGYLAGFLSEAEVLRVAQVRSNMASLIDTEARLDVYDFEPAEGYDFATHSDSGAELWARKVASDGSFDSRILKSFSMKGSMAVVGCESNKVENAISELNLQETRVACYNAPKGQTISGAAFEVNRLLEKLKHDNPSLFIRLLPTDGVAYHAPYLSVFQNYLRESFGDISAAPLPSSWISTSQNGMFGTDYLIQNICGPVYFEEGINSLPTGATIVEIGPSSGLLAQVKRIRQDLTLIGIAEREKPVDVDAVLRRLEPWVNAEPAVTTDEVETKSSKALRFEERYPDIWGGRTTLQVPTWKEFELPRTLTGSPEVSYDLSKPPWSSIRDHQIRGQNLFPAVGFLHALWSVHDFGLVEIVDFRIDTPLVIPTGSEKVKFQVRQAGTHCYICDSLGEVCYASGRVKPAPPTARPTEHSPVQGQDGIEKEYFYPHLRRLGYEYGTSYQLLDNITAEHASLTKQPVDWISYLDACLHLELHNCSCLGYPVGFDRVILWERSLENAALWVKKISADSLGNSSIILDGLKMEYVPDSPLLPSIYKETFVEYDDCDVLHEPHVVAALLLRESATFCVVEPLLSTELQAIVHCLRECSMSRETKLEIWVVVSDRITADADLLLTTDKERPMFSYIPVARWGELRLLRGGNGVKIGKLKVAKNWNEVPMSGPFLWTGDGSSGAVASVVAERGQTAISYEGATNGLIGLEKQMRHNYFNKDGQHGVWVDVKQPGCTSAEGPTSPNAELRIGRPGLLDSLVWHVIDPKRHSVKIKFATLNFRDVMRAMGQLKEKDLSLGLEFSGTEIASNKRVFGVARNSLSSHCSPAYSFPTPDNISDEEAATIPIVYLTAYFALFKKAKMTAGQSVLIHGGAGGVGMAAIRLAQKRGLTIFTTCSSGKRGYLKDHFRLSDAQIGDSRSETFIQTVLSGTRGRGVDVVLNHLSGSLQVASLRCVASGGHFCEIGKYDILQNTGLRQGLLARNVSFHVIDLLPLLMDSAMLSVWDSMLRNGFESNEIVPLPVTAFKVENVVDAFRFMSQGKHMGKIGIKGLDSHEFPVGHDALIAQQESHLITGGLGGLGLSLASRLASDGCREVILVGRRGVTTGFQRHQLASMEAMGCKVRIVKSDVLNLKPEMTVSVPDRIWHVATVYRDMAFDTMTKSAWDAVVRTKVDGYMCLRACWPSTPIVAISSVVAYYGNAGQTHYALANARLDSFARSDPNTLSVRLGPLDNVGFITKSDTGRALLERFPIKLMRVDDVLDRLLEVGIKNRCGVVGVYDLKQRGVSSLSKSGKRQASRQYTIEQAQQFVASILGGSAKDYSPQISLKSAGLDSLSTMEVVHHIHEMDRSTSFKASMITEEFTVQSIVDAVKAVKVDVGLDDDDKSSDLSIESGSAGPSTARENAQDVMTEAAGEDNTIHVQGDETERLLTLSNGIHGRILTSIEEGWTRRRVLVGAGLMLSTLWWICSLAAFDKGQAEHILLYSFIVCCGCDLVRLFVDWHMRNGNTVREPVSCSHYLQGVLSFIAYVLMFVIYPATFLRNWSSVYFGYYMYDNLSLLIFWDDINRAFRDFYALHHIISFTLTGFWRVPSGSWNVKLGMLVMLWLTSEIWQYSLYVFRHFAGHGKCTARKIAILGVVAFVSERLQRFSAYLLLFLLDDKITHRAWLVFATGIAFDVLDTYFQLKALHRQFSSVNPLPKSSERSFSESMLRQESPDIEMGEGWSSEPD